MFELIPLKTILTKKNQNQWHKEIKRMGGTAKWMEFLVLHIYSYTLT